MPEHHHTSYLGFTIIVTAVGFTVLDRSGAVFRQVSSMTAARKAVSELRRAEREEASRAG